MVLVRGVEEVWRLLGTHVLVFEHGDKIPGDAGDVERRGVLLVHLAL